MTVELTITMELEHPDEMFTDTCEPRCQVTRSRYGRGQCENAVMHVVVTDGTTLPHLLVRVCDKCASFFQELPGWSVRVFPRGV